MQVVERRELKAFDYRTASSFVALLTPPRKLLRSAPLVQMRRLWVMLVKVLSSDVNFVTQVLLTIITKTSPKILVLLSNVLKILTKSFHYTCSVWCPTNWIWQSTLCINNTNIKQVATTHCINKSNRIPSHILEV